MRGPILSSPVGTDSPRPGSAGYGNALGKTGLLEKTLEQHGAKGWELVEVLPQHDSPGVYRLIFKAPKPLD
jgi:hypothetical protein